MRTRTKNPMRPVVPIGSGPNAAVFGGGGLSVASFLESTPKARATHQRLNDLDVAMRNAESRAKSGEWDGATGAVLVGLYAMLHVRVYQIRPEELTAQVEFRRASSQAKRLLHAHFGDDADAMVEFVKWAWQREKKRAEWARNQGTTRTRLSWRFLFSASMVSDYRVDQHNEKVRGRT